MPGEKHDVRFHFDDGKYIYKSSCLNDIFKSKKLSKDGLCRVQGMSGFLGADMNSENKSFLSLGDPLVHTSKEVYSGECTKNCEMKCCSERCCTFVCWKLNFDVNPPTGMSKFYFDLQTLNNIACIPIISDHDSDTNKSIKLTICNKYVLHQEMKARFKRRLVPTSVDVCSIE